MRGNRSPCSSTKIPPAASTWRWWSEKRDNRAVVGVSLTPCASRFFNGLNSSSRSTSHTAKLLIIPIVELVVISLGRGGGNLPKPPKSPLTNWQLNTTKSTPSPNRLSLLNQLMVRYSKVSSNLLKEYLDISKIKVPSKNLITSYCLICQRYF